MANVMFVMMPFIGISYSEYLVEKLSIFTCYESMINLHSVRTDPFALLQLTVSEIKLNVTVQSILFLSRLLAFVG